jgi:hypothetical protein
VSQSGVAEARPPIVPRALVRTQTAEEREYERRLRQIAARRRRVEALRLEVASLAASLGRFEAACNDRVGDLVVELRRVRRAVGDYERRLERLLLGAAGAAAAAAEEEPGPFARAEDGPAGDPAGAGPTATGRPKPPRLDEPAEAELKRLYFDLAKRCHPDFARDDAERRRREALMARINEAFRARDLAALAALGREADVADPDFAARPPRERLAWALAEVARLDDLLADLKEEAASLRRGELHRLWRRYEERGARVLDALEDDLEARLTAEGRRLDRLIAAYRRALDERQAAMTA